MRKECEAWLLEPSSPFHKKRKKRRWRRRAFLLSDKTKQQKILSLTSDPKVGDFDVPARRQQQVAALDVPVSLAARVDVGDPGQRPADHAGDGGLCEPPAGPDVARGDQRRRILLLLRRGAAAAAAAAGESILRRHSSSSCSRSFFAHQRQRVGHRPAVAELHDQPQVPAQRPPGPPGADDAHDAAVRGGAAQGGGLGVGGGARRRLFLRRRGRRRLVGSGVVGGCRSIRSSSRLGGSSCRLGGLPLCPLAPPRLALLGPLGAPLGLRLLPLPRGRGGRGDGGHFLAQEVEGPADHARATRAAAVGSVVGGASVFRIGVVVVRILVFFLRLRLRVGIRVVVVVVIVIVIPSPAASKRSPSTAAVIQPSSPKAVADVDAKPPRDDLDRDEPARRRVARRVDDPVRAAPDLVEQLESVLGVGVVDDGGGPGRGGRGPRRRRGRGRGRERGGREMVALLLLLLLPLPSATSRGRREEAPRGGGGDDGGRARERRRAGPVVGVRLLLLFHDC